MGEGQAIKEQAETTKELLGWWGSTEDLQRLVSVIRPILDKRAHDSIEAARTVYEEEQIDRGDVRKSYALTDFNKSLERIRDDWTLEAEAQYRHDARKLTSSASRILDNLDLRDLRSLTFRAGDILHGDRINLVLNDRAITLTITATDVSWLRSVEANIIAGLKRNCPPLTRIRSMIVIYAAVLPCAIGATLFIHYYPIRSGMLSGAIGICVGILPWLIYYCSRRLLPAFDLYAPGTQGRTARRIAAIAVWVLPIVLAVLGIVLPRLLP